MKKIFLILLLACFTCVMAFAATVPVGTYAELKDAVDNATPGDVIELTKDISFGNVAKTNQINITKSITIDGKGFTLTGSSQRQSGAAQYATIWINDGASNDLNVTVKNITLVNKATSGNYAFCIQPRGGQNTITLENVIMDLTAGGRSNSAPLQFGGNETRISTLNATNCKFLGKSSDYPVLSWVPVNITAQDSYFSGYCGVYFKDGSKGSSLTADACNFDAPNIYSGQSNAFAVFPMEDTPLTFNLNNCGMNAEQIGDQGQPVFCFSEWTKDENRAGQVNITLSGDNTHINCETEWIWNSFWWNNPSGNPQYGSNYDPTITTAEAALHVNVNAQISGGTYSVDPREMIYWNDQYKDGEGYHYNLGHITIPEGYEVKEITMEGVATPLYRVVKSAAEKEPGVMYDLNDLVAGEGVDEGNNPVSSFDLSTGTDMTLNQETTTAGYVQVKDNATEGATTVTIGTPSQDQTLVINNGLDVQGESQVIVQAGSTLEIGEGGINTEQPSNIVIGADENGAASLIMDPTITVNQTPNLTVKMKAKQIGWIMASGKEYYWHRFALPIQQASTWVKNPNKSTYVFGWNYSTNDWEQLSALTQMVPFKGYTLTADYEGLGDVEYTFTGQLAGNTNNLLEFERNGFNFFGNSYTGYIDILALVDQIMGDNKIDGTVWMWYQDNQSYVAIPLQALRDNPNSFDSWMREVAPMQTFILKQNGSENATTELNYASAIWGNPRYGHNTSSPAPQRIQNDETARMRIIVKAENGKSDFVMLTEDGRFSDAFEKGYDGEKYMNENALNMYATVNDVDYTAVATDNLAGKALTLNTVESVNYTMSFAKVNGEAYAIRDLMTNIITPITEGNTYTFAAQPNTTIEGRFVIVPMQNMPTDVETVETTPAVKGIYTIMGQYVGEDFDILPAGIYVVDGVKIVK